MTAGCIFIVNGNSTQGSGNIITGEREVSEFNKLHLKGSGNVFLSQGEEQSLIIKTDDNILPLIETDVSGKKLTISHGKHNLRPTVFEVFITVKNIEDVAISGSGIVREGWRLRYPAQARSIFRERQRIIRFQSADREKSRPLRCRPKMFQ
jgi:hypothetical protein